MLIQNKGNKDIFKIMSDVLDEIKRATCNVKIDSNCELYGSFFEDILAKSKAEKRPEFSTVYEGVNESVGDEDSSLISPPSQMLNDNELESWFVIMSHSYKSNGLAFILRLQRYALAMSRFRIYDPAMSFIDSFDDAVIMGEIKKYTEREDAIDYQMFMVILPNDMLAMYSSFKNITSTTLSFNFNYFI
ncbi:unnamed protein product [Gordionus sp. m RMFG-2023]